LGRSFFAVLLSDIVSIIYWSTADESTSRTYLCNQRAREADALQSTRAIPEQFLLDVSAQELESIITTAGLRFQRLDKGDCALILAGQGVQTTTLTFMVSSTGDVEISALPGTTACETSGG